MVRIGEINPAGYRRKFFRINKSSNGKPHPCIVTGAPLFFLLHNNGFDREEEGAKRPPGLVN